MISRRELEREWLRALETEVTRRGLNVPKADDGSREKLVAELTAMAKRMKEATPGWVEPSAEERAARREQLRQIILEQRGVDIDAG